ncbi:Oidioi.mRNA.OKI2018_I69.PAR.g8997.t1.cds [Oikopleura dioica]|uniref:Oidioi.mRNA.OKI2018_I69.PAR.g8997.t1.cds n=1 Tax=Oikopleura dioica TaxID=34765 RepID=A0ABN7RL68_OIKDI|nr:Oidioi.mRNA.OKI2018_I69.PAR.g8997.t1.cds [Oikopleura dioica]
MKTIAIFGTISQAALVRNYAHYDDETWRAPIYESFLPDPWSDKPCYDYIHSVHPSKWLNDGLFLPDCTADGLYHPTQCNFQNHRCWCVEPDGQKIANSEIPLWRVIREPETAKCIHRFREFLNGKGRFPVNNIIEKSTTTTEEPATSTFNPKWAETTYSVQTEATTALTDSFTSTEAATIIMEDSDPVTTPAESTTFSNTAVPSLPTTTEEFLQIELFPILNLESSETEDSQLVTLTGPGIFAAPKEEDFVKFSSSNFAVAMMKAPEEEILLIEEGSGATEVHLEGSGE